MDNLSNGKDYTKRTIILCFLMVMVCLGLCSSGRTLYLTAITDALDIPRGAFSLGQTFRCITSAVFSAFLGKLIAKFGTRKLIISGFLCLIVFAVLNVIATRLITFYISNIFLGLGLAWAGTTMASTVVNRVCKENKGTYTGLVLSANGIGGAIAAQIITPIIFQEGNPFGYRNSYIMVACVLAVVMTAFLLFYKEPKKTGNEPEGKKNRKKRGAGWIGMDFEQAIKKPYFYITVLCVGLTGVVLTGLSGIAVPHMYDIGIDVGIVAIISSIGSILLTVSKFSTGVTFDRYGTRVTMNICYICMIASVFALIFVSNTKLGVVIAFVRSIVASFALPLDTVMIPLFASGLFGNKSFDKVIGIFVAAAYIGTSIGSPLGNVVYDIFGNYNLAFIIFGIIAVMVIITMQFVLSAANRDKKKILADEEKQVQFA